MKAGVVGCTREFVAVPEPSLPKPGQKAYKKDDWNHIKVVCKGKRIQTWLNGVKRADFEDDLDQSGFIALQVHGVGKNTAKMLVSWRNITIKELK